MYKAVFTDMDGTLLRADHSISEETKELIGKIIAANILFVLVSARPIHGIIPTSKWLGTESLPIVSLNGAYIAYLNEVIFESAIDMQMISAIHEIAASYPVTLIYYGGMEWFAEQSNAATDKEQLITDVRVQLAPFNELQQRWSRQNTQINKIMAIGEATVISAMEDKLHDAYSGQMNVYTSKPTYLEMMRIDASKTNAVKFIQARYDISREAIIAIGDNYNDKEMIAYAGTGIAMGNAPDPVKAVAGYITDTNQQDGVRKAFEKFLQL